MKHQNVRPLQKILNCFRHPSFILYYFDNAFFHILKDSYYLKLQYKLKNGGTLHIENPVTFNEKLQWLKLHDKKSEYTQMADKYEVREFVAEKIGEKYLIPLIGVWDTFDEIDFDKLPNQFVLKCTHDSGSVVICKDKSKLNLKAVKKRMNTYIKRNFYYYGREWAYKNIKPRIVAEKFMEEEAGSDLKDYKIFCFNGEPKIIQVDIDRFIEHKRNFYSPQWEYQSVGLKYPTASNINIPKPEQLEKMLELARTLSASSTFLRVDFYFCENKIFFGELTFYPELACGQFSPPEWDKTFGDWMKLDSLTGTGM